MESRRRVEARFDAERWDGPEWLVLGATLTERLNEPYDLRLDVALATADVDASVLLGSSCVLSLVRRSTTLRVCGIVTMVREGTDPNHRTNVALAVEPALSALRYRADSRIFQDRTVPQIVEEVLGADLAAFGRRVELRLDGTYPTREYTVQYQETDFDFAHRLMEEEGIGYYFEHDGEQELIVLFDRIAHHAMIEGEESSALRYVGRFDSELDATEGVARFESVSRIRPNRVVARHFDWTHPSVPIEASADLPDAAWPALETYLHDAPVTFHGYDHTYGAHNMADQLRVASEWARRDAWLTEGTGSSLAVRAGRRFELSDHPRMDLDGEWTIVATQHRYLGHVIDREAEGMTYVNRFTCLPGTVPWRPDRTRRRPRIVGVQTATVVGPAGEEIHCDPHGRVKVHFHWDRLGARDDHDSCWIRVMQTMGGPGWGFAFIPRIGMEVVVTFVEGDPNQPLITGTVYNAENPPPYEFPADKTRTTIRTNSSPGGEGFNELRFEDRAGNEEIWLHGEKDWNTLIKNDLNRQVGHNESQEVAVDRTRHVGNDETITIGHDQTTRVEHDETEIVAHDRVRQVGNDENITIGADRAERVGGNERHSIGKDLVEKVGANVLQTVGSMIVQNIGANRTINVGQNSTESIVMDEITTVGANATRRVGLNSTLKIGANLTQKIGMDEKTSVVGSRALDVGGDEAITVAGAAKLEVGGGYAIDVTGAFSHKITGDASWEVVSGGGEGGEGEGGEGEGGEGGEGEGGEGEGGEGEGESGGSVTWKIEKSLVVEIGEKLSIKVKDAMITVEDNAITFQTPGAITVRSDAAVLVAGTTGVDVKSTGGTVIIQGGPLVKINC